MADGRMLKKAICTSRKLAALETDTARLIYTWLIPHLDIEGRYSADPDVIKGTVVPRIKTITSDIVQECIEHMSRVGLILVYEVDGDRFLQYKVFSKHQNLYKDREKASIIPPPPTSSQDKSCELLQQHENSPQDKIREEKLKKQDSADAAPVDNSKKPALDTTEKLKIISEAIYKAGFWDKVNTFVKQYKGKNKEALLHTLERFFKENGNGHRIDNPWGYCLKILKVEEGNYNARDSTAMHEAMKKQEKHDLKDKKIGDLCKGIP